MIVKQTQSRLVDARCLMNWDSLSLSLCVCLHPTMVMWYMSYLIDWVPPRRHFLSTKAHVKCPQKDDDPVTQPNPLSPRSPLPRTTSDSCHRPLRPSRYHLTPPQSLSLRCETICPSFFPLPVFLFLLFSSFHFSFCVDRPDRNQDYGKERKNVWGLQDDLFFSSPAFGE